MSNSVDIIDAIVDRAQAMEWNYLRYRGPRSTWMMDLMSAHAHIPLDLERLFAADDANFSHDVFGIRRHINRETGKLEGGFRPRFAKYEAPIWDRRDADRVDGYDRDDLGESPDF